MRPSAPPASAAPLVAGVPADVDGREIGLATTPSRVTESGEGFVGRSLGPGFWISVAWIVLVALAAVFANALPLQDPTTIGEDAPKLGPSLGHLLGTDDLGRDMLARLVFGARVSLTVGFASIAFGIIIGGAIGLLAGYYGGLVDVFLSGISNVLLAFPALIFLLSIVTFLGQTLPNITLALGVLSIAPLARVIRGNTVIYANREFVLAARVSGATDLRILAREILPNVMPAVAAYSLVAVAVVIVVEGSLSFLGLSVRPPTPTWGGMISEGSQVLAQGPLVALWPSLAMFATVLALNLAGDRLQAYFEVREGAL